MQSMANCMYFSKTNEDPTEYHVLINQYTIRRLYIVILIQSRDI